MLSCEDVVSSSVLLVVGRKWFRVRFYGGIDAVITLNLLTIFLDQVGQHDFN
jgi:hypothetical protein